MSDASRETSIGSVLKRHWFSMVVAAILLVVVTVIITNWIAKSPIGNHALQLAGANGNALLPQGITLTVIRLNGAVVEIFGIDGAGGFSTGKPYTRLPPELGMLLQELYGMVSAQNDDIAELLNALR